MCSVGELVQEVASESGFLSIRQTSGQTCAARDVSRQLAESLSLKISNLAALDASGARDLMDAVRAANYADTDKDRIGAAIDSKLLHGATGVPCNGTPTQRMENVDQYKTASLQASLSDPRATLDSKVQLLADYLTGKGCNNPNEQTLKQWLAFLLICHFKFGWPSYTSIFNTLIQLKQVVASSRKPFPFAIIMKYPTAPYQLPEAQFKYLYPDEEPDTTPTPALARIANHHIPLRKNSKLLTEDAKQANCSPMSSGAAASGSIRPHWVDELVSCFQGAQQPALHVPGLRINTPETNAGQRLSRSQSSQSLQESVASAQQAPTAQHEPKVPPALTDGSELSSNGASLRPLALRVLGHFPGPSDARQGPNTLPAFTDGSAPQGPNTSPALTDGSAPQQRKTTE